MKGFLTKDQRKELLRELKNEDNARFSDRIKTILLLDEGTIANYRRRYKACLL